MKGLKVDVNKAQIRITVMEMKVKKFQQEFSSESSRHEMSQASCCWSILDSTCGKYNLTAAGAGYRNHEQILFWDVLQLALTIAHDAGLCLTSKARSNCGTVDPYA